jgi:hypothetical protein
MEVRSKRSLRARARDDILGLDPLLTSPENLLDNLGSDLSKFKGVRKPMPQNPGETGTTSDASESKRPEVKEKSRVIPLPTPPPTVSPENASNATEQPTSTEASNILEAAPSRYSGSPQFSRPALNPFYDLFVKTLSYTGYDDKFLPVPGVKFNEAEFAAIVKKQLLENNVTKSDAGFDYSWLSCYALPFGSKFSSYGPRPDQKN